MLVMDCCLPLRNSLSRCVGTAGMALGSTVVIIPGFPNRNLPVNDAAFIAARWTIMQPVLVFETGAFLSGLNVTLRFDWFEFSLVDLFGYTDGWVLWVGWRDIACATLAS